jgi:hypothetical protein
MQEQFSRNFNAINDQVGFSVYKRERLWESDSHKRLRWAFLPST